MASYPQRDIETQGRSIADRFRDAGGFMSRTPRSSQLATIRKEAEEWIREVEKGISTQSPEGICRYLSWYDIVHRIAFGIPGDGSFIDRWQLRILEQIEEKSFSNIEVSAGCREWLLTAVRNRLSRSPRTVSPLLRDWLHHPSTPL